jgi:predicted Rossmann fold flavoprotein
MRGFIAPGVCLRVMVDNPRRSHAALCVLSPRTLKQMTHDTIILGAGAAGLFAAAETGRHNGRVLLLDNGEKPGRKILISGGGRCNFTNLGARAENFLSNNPHFAKSALARYTPRDFIALVEKHGIAFHEKTLGQLFCDTSARDIVAMLEKECAEAHVTTLCSTHITAVRKPAGEFILETSRGTYTCAKLIVATGGLSIPSLGATAFGYELARQFGHTVIEPRAALVPLVFNPEDAEHWCDLTGTSAETITTTHTKATRGKAPAFREKFLITHRGLSGPAILQVSSYWRPGEAVTLDLAPGREVFTSILAGKSPRDLNTLYAALKIALPQRIAERWLTLRRHDIRFTNAGLAALEQDLHAWTFTPAGTEGHSKAEVTAGGVHTAELDARTLESKIIPGLHFIGEVVDVTGWLGGYNFQWAWSSAIAATRHP